MDASTASPVKLAEEIVNLVSGADNDTVNAALTIADVLLRHRRLAEIDFNHKCRTGEQ